MKRFSSLLLASSMLVSLATPAIAAEFMAEEELSISVPVGGDLYAVGGRVTINEPVSGDLVVFGGQLEVSGNVSEDLTAAGGEVTIDGNVGDDLRVAGGDVRLNGNVAGDVLVAGGSIRISENTVITGDLVVTGGEVRLEGEVDGDLTVHSGVIHISGVVLGVTKVNADEVRISGDIRGVSTLVASSISIEEGAIFASPVSYWTEAGEMDFGIAATQGATYDAELAPARSAMSDTEKAGIFAVIASAVIGYSLLSAAFILILMLLLTKTYFPDAAKRLKAEPWMSLLYGFLYFVCTPILGVLLLITIIGIPLAGVVFAVYAISIVFASVLSALVIAKWAQLYWQKKWGNVAVFFVAMLAYILLKILSLIPVVGWIVKAVIVFMAFGALMHTKWVKYRKIR